MKMRRRRNPKLSERLKLSTVRELGARKIDVRVFADEIIAGQVGKDLKEWIFEGRQREMSTVQIRKALMKAVQIAVKSATRKRR